MAEDDYRALRWYGDTDGPWSASAAERYRREGYDGLAVVPGGSWAPADLSFLRGLPGLRYFTLEHHLRRDTEAFTVETLEELSLVTGSRLPVPETTQPHLVALTLTDRDGVEVASRWPALRILRLGGVRAADCRRLSGAGQLTELYLEARKQPLSLDGIEDCRRLRVLEVLDAAVPDLGPLAKLDRLDTVRLMASPRRRHGRLDLAAVRGSRLAQLWISHPAELVNVAALAEIASLREVRVIGCSDAVGELAELRRRAPRIKVEWF